MTALTLLKEARAIIDEKGWTQGAYARDDRGAFIDVTSSRAVCFCTLGALRRAQVDLKDSVSLDSYKTAALWLNEAGVPRGFGSWNDAPTRTKVDVLAMFDKAIALAEEGAPRE